MEKKNEDRIFFHQQILAKMIENLLPNEDKGDKDKCDKGKEGNGIRSPVCGCPPLVCLIYFLHFSFSLFADHSFYRAPNELPDGFSQLRTEMILSSPSLNLVKF